MIGFYAGIRIMADLWSVFDYEVQMFRDLMNLCRGNMRLTFPPPIPNAITESLVLHTRILTCVLISRGRADDIKLETLLPGFTMPEIDILKTLYGKDDDPKSICWTLNKRLAHATAIRADSDGHDYGGSVQTLRPFIEYILGEVEKVRPR